MVNFVHAAVTVEANSEDFLYPGATSKNGKRYKCSKWTPKKHRDIDLVLTNCQEESARIATLLLKKLEYWEKNITPHLMNTKIGRADNYLRAAVVCVASCCVSKLLPPEKVHEIGISFIESPDSIICHALNENINPPSGETATMDLGLEAMQAIFSAIYKHWVMTYKKTDKKFGSTIAFIRAWKKIAKGFLEYPVHIDRDVKLHHLVDGVVTPANVEKHPVDGTLLYPINTAASVITSDYQFKLLSELVLSPHINIEWKITMCEFMIKYASKMLSGLETDITKSANDVSNDNAAEMTCEYGSKPASDCFTRYGTKFNPSRIMPRAANFWDFCRGGCPPSELSYSMIFNEPSSNPDLSSGAGLFGLFTGGVDDKKEEDQEVSAALNSLKILLGLRETESAISTRRWREEGSVVSFNFCPLTIAGANLGYGEQITKNMPAGFWLKTVQKSITESAKRKRIIDKGSRNCDLLSDGGNFSLTTIAFGCSNMLKQLTGISTFNVKVNYEDSIQVYGPQRVMTHSFPSL